MSLDRRRAGARRPATTARCSSPTAARHPPGAHPPRTCARTPAKHAWATTGPALHLHRRGTPSAPPLRRHPPRREERAPTDDHGQDPAPQPPAPPCATSSPVPTPSPTSPKNYSTSATTTDAQDHLPPTVCPALIQNLFTPRPTQLLSFVVSCFNYIAVRIFKVERFG
jgi:hypothetical protein